MTFKARRCPAKISGLQCEMERDHSGMHGAYDLDQELFLHWFDAPVDEPKRKLGGPRVTKRTEPIYSWRWWVFGRRGILQSIASKSEWFTPTMTTKETPKGEPARVASKNPIGNPSTYHLVKRDPYVDFGVFSYKSPKLLYETNPGWFRKGRFDPMVLGKLENRGHVVEHELGYRSQIVVVRELWVFHEDPEIRFNTGWLRATKKRYDCEVHTVPREKLEGWVEFYSDPEELDA